MDAGKLIDVILKALEFRSTVLTLVLGATAFAIGRMWPEKSLVPDRRLMLRFAPAFGFCIAAFWKLGRDFAQLAAAAAGSGMMVFTANWLNDVFWVDLMIGAAFLCLCLGVGLARP